MKIEEVRDLYIKIVYNYYFQEIRLSAGWLFLYAYFDNNAVDFEFKWLIFFIIAVMSATLACALLIVGFYRVTKNPKTFSEIFYRDSKGPRKKTSSIFPPSFPRRLPYVFKLALMTSAEDGLFFVPLIYIGINPVSAFLFAALFAILHYPSFKITACIPKGAWFFAAAVLILPRSGIAPIVAGHFLIDLIILSLPCFLSIPYKFYYTDGTLKEEGTSIRKLREGLIKTYYPSGKLQREFYCSKDKVDGKSQKFFENGTLAVDASYKKGLLDGLFRSYNEDGTLKTESQYCNGARVVSGQEKP